MNLRERGLVKKCDYCEECAGLVDSYFLARDDLHSRVVLEFEGGLAAIRAEFDDANPDFRRPDE
jgi:hypothetical protein